MTQISIIIPAYNEEKRLDACLSNITNHMKQLDTTWECIIIENGSTDQTAYIARSWAAVFFELRALSSSPGKGAAVRRGMLAARGRYRYMCDVDLSTPIQAIQDFCKLTSSGINNPDGLPDGFDVVIGSRNLPNSIRENEPDQRHHMGKVFNAMVQMYLLMGIFDSQCGFKMFTDRAALDLFGRSMIDGWAFDVEILYLARRLGYSIHEMPVKWVYDDDTRVQGFKTAWAMFLDLLKIKRNAQKGLYRIKKAPEMPQVKLTP